MVTSNMSACPSPDNNNGVTSTHSTAYLVIYILFSTTTIVGLASFLYLKHSLGRLKKRSGTLVFVSCCGALLSFIVILLREWISPSSFPCPLLITGHLLSVPIVLGPLVAKLFVHQWRMRRAAIRAELSFAALRREQERIADERKEKPPTGGGLSALATDVAEFVTLKRNKSKGSMLSAKVDMETGAFEMSRPGGTPFRIDEDQEDVPVPAIETRSSRRGWMNNNNTRDDGGGSSRSPTASPGSPGGGGGPRSVPSTRLTNTNTNNNNDAGARPSTTESQKTKRQSSVGSWFSSSPIFALGLGTSDAAPDIPLKDLLRHESSVFGLIMCALFSVPSIVTLAVRMTTDATYSTSNVCFGCTFEAQDVYYILGLLFLILISFFRGAWMVRGSPDPLGIVTEVVVSVSFCLLFCGIGFLLHLLDPLNTDSNHVFAWLTFEAIGIMGVVVLQTYGQIIAAFWSNRRQGINNISLFRVLENGDLRILFDRHLAREISIENLRFWDRAVMWKANYAAMDAETRQRYAEELYHVFIHADAAMPLNLASGNQRALDQAFYFGAPNVGRDVFDNALKEAYKLMKDGLSRFVRTSEFAKNASKSDFEGDELRNQELGLGKLDLDINEYLAQLSTYVGTRPSRTEDRRVSFIRSLKVVATGATDKTNTTPSPSSFGGNTERVAHSNNNNDRRRSTMEAFVGGDDDNGTSRPLSIKLALTATSDHDMTTTTSTSSLTSGDSRKRGSVRKPSATVRKPSLVPKLENMDV